MRQRRLFWLFLIVLFGVLTLTGLPYYYGIRSAGEDNVFGGFLLNPLDGNTYLAKMYQGWQGDWTYSLPYTAQKPDGAYLFLFYLFLGHIARISGLSLIDVFHLARLITSGLMILTLYRFIKVVLPEGGVQGLSFLLAAFGSGMGWMALIAGQFTADFWVAEAYPFLSAYANPHFPLGMAAILWLLTPILEWRQSVIKREWTTPIIVLILSIVSPFGIVLVFIIIGALVFWENYVEVDRMLPTLYGWRWVLVVILGFPLLVYNLWIVYFDPVYAGWNVQNLTPSPGLLEFIISFSPAILLVIPGYSYLRRVKIPHIRVVALWFFMGVVLLYLPWSLQRRFIFGLYIPTSILASMGLKRIWSKGGVRWLGIALLILAVPTNVMVLLAARQGISTNSPLLYMGKSEYEAFQWIEDNTPVDSVILAAPETGLFIPAHTGRRVIYGHPYETIAAKEQKIRVDRFFNGTLLPGDVNPVLEADYVFYGPRERALGGRVFTENLSLVFEQQDVQIFLVNR